MKKTNNAFLIFAWIVFGIFLTYRLLVIFYPQPDAGGVEGNVIYFIQRILDGQVLYTDPEIPPFAIGQYTPLYYYLVAAFARIFSIAPDEVLKLFMVSRTVSLILNLIFAAIAFTVSRKIYGAARSHSIIAGILCFIFLEITSFSRPDSLYHVFFFISLLFFFRLVEKGNDNSNTGLLALFSLACVLSFFSKQTGLILPVAAGIWFLWQKHYELLVKFALIYIFFLGGGLLLAHQLYGIDVFYKNVILGVANGISPWWFYRILVPSFHFYFGFLFIIASFALWYLLRKNADRITQLSLFLMIFLFVSMNIAALKYGSGAGYFTEWVVLVIVTGAAWFPRGLTGLRGANKRIPVMVLGVIMLAKTVFLYEPFHHMLVKVLPSARRAAYEKQKDIAHDIEQNLKPGEGYVVFMNHYTPDTYLSNLLFRHAVVPQMDIVALASYPQKRYDYTQFDRQLDTGAFRFMIMKEKGLPKQFYEHKLEHYKLIENRNGYSIYEFKR